MSLVSTWLMSDIIRKKLHCIPYSQTPLTERFVNPKVAHLFKQLLLELSVTHKCIFFPMPVNISLSLQCYITLMLSSDKQLMIFSGLSSLCSKEVEQGAEESAKLECGQEVAGIEDHGLQQLLQSHFQHTHVLFCLCLLLLFYNCVLSQLWRTAGDDICMHHQTCCLHSQKAKFCYVY